MRIIPSVSLAALLIVMPNAMSVVSAKPMAQINNTTYVFVDPAAKMKVRQTTDAKGNYIENAMNGKHIDHGTAMIKDGKACFTSAMNSDGESCYTVSPVAIGHSTVVTSDKGVKVRVTRVKYTPLKMPK